VELRARRYALVGVVALSALVEGLSSTFTWPARIATGCTIVAVGIAGWSGRPRSLCFAAPPRRSVVAGVLAATGFAAVELVALVHPQRARWPTFSSIVERVVAHTSLGPVSVGRVVLTLVWAGLGWWLVVP